MFHYQMVLYKSCFPASIVNKINSNQAFFFERMMYINIEKEIRIYNKIEVTLYGP